MKYKKYHKSKKWEINKIIVISLVFVILAGVTFGIFRYYQTTFRTFEKGLSLDLAPETIATNNQNSEITTKVVPESKDLLVPYAPQAPLSNWAVHEESCEEAAAYMYRSYLENISYPANRVPDAEADTAFRAMKAWQVSHYGKEPDLTMTALGEFARSYYGYTPTVLKNITAEDIKVAVSDGHPVIVPVMTHSLENTMYGPVSVYHVLLIKGYDATGVITNDAGVGNGPNHHYTWEILWQAIDAQTAKMNQGREMLYLTK